MVILFFFSVRLALIQLVGSQEGRIEVITTSTIACSLVRKYAALTAISEQLLWSMYVLYKCSSYIVVVGARRRVLLFYFRAALVITHVALQVCVFAREDRGACSRAWMRH